jgi:site-specific DNA recombinase
MPRFCRFSQVLTADDAHPGDVDLLAATSHAPIDIPDIHPNVAGLYCRKVERLAETLHPQGIPKVAIVLRSTSISYDL